MHVGVSPTCMYGARRCGWSFCKWSDGCELPCGFLGLNLGPLWDQHILLTADPHEDYNYKAAAHRSKQEEPRVSCVVLLHGSLRRALLLLFWNR